MKRLTTGIAKGVTVVGLLVVAAAIALAGPAQSSGPPDTSSEAERIREIERTRLEALVDADMNLVEQLHAEDFRLVPPPGFPLSRGEYVAAVAAGDLDYLVFEPISAIEVRLYGQAAVVTYESTIDIVAAGVGRLTHDAWHTYVYEKRHGRWQVVWEQATAVGGFPPA